MFLILANLAFGNPKGYKVYVWPYSILYKIHSNKIQA